MYFTNIFFLQFDTHMTQRSDSSPPGLHQHPNLQALPQPPPPSGGPLSLSLGSLWALTCPAGSMNVNAQWREPEDQTHTHTHTLMQLHTHVPMFYVVRSETQQTEHTNTNTHTYTHTDIHCRYIAAPKGHTSHTFLLSDQRSRWQIACLCHAGSPGLSEDPL